MATDLRAHKLPAELLERADALVEPMREAKASELAAASHKTASAVVRVALALGLEQLEKRYPPATTP
jgi:hypothetical protein